MCVPPCIALTPNLLAAVNAQHKLVTKRLQTYLADRGEFHLLHDLSETLDIHGTSRGIVDLLEYFVLQIGTLKPDLSDQAFRGVFQSLVRWCHEPWVLSSNKSESDAACSVAQMIAAICGMMARLDALREDMLEYGVVEAMVTLLQRSKQVGTLEQAAACLSNLMLKSNAGRDAVVSSGGLSVLVTHLHSSAHPRVQEKACAAMANLACSNLTKEVIVSHNGILPLVGICRTQGCERATENAARAIRNLAHNSAPNCSIIAGCGGLDVMASLCENAAHAGIASQASAAVSNLAVNDRNRAEIKEKWGWSAKVMYALESSDSKSRHKHRDIIATRSLPEPSKSGRRPR